MQRKRRMAGQGSLVHPGIDEGFSEGNESLQQDEAPLSSPHVAHDAHDDVLAHAASVRDWILAQPLELRTEFARVILSSLSTAALSSIVREADERLHFDPASYFPQEIVLQIFSYLSPEDLLKASYVCRRWRIRAQEPVLWRRLFSLEGWTRNQRMIESLEARSSELPKLVASAKAGRIRFKNANFVPAEDGEDTIMDEGVHGDCPLIHPPNLAFAGPRQPHWKYLFAQRQRLEQNWQKGLYKTFRLPKEGFEHEKHRECIYTLQFSSKHVVSGSRDRTVRIWDLETQRLKVSPLVGHRASVLCLQFDESPDQDVIISGGSDSDVIVWKFSTGEKIKHLRKAHSQSVLNLRFDDRYLVTCSRDNSIKVWSRQLLYATDPAYPATNISRDATFPSWIVNVQSIDMDPAARMPPPLEPYTELMTFVGHTAAVNAISIHGDRVASASGDRKIMLWNLRFGRLVRTYSGHSKGIACVQYDGRRIISGSSDESVRIFDAETAAEVSFLNGHRDLVRTIQADFGDLPGDEIEDAAKAAAHSERVIQVLQLQGTDAVESSLDLPHIIGAKLPPGGGGNRWSKIVSGSYDETVIIWRQDKNGRWIITRELRVDDALRTTARTRPVETESRLPTRMTPEMLAHIHADLHGRRPGAISQARAQRPASLEQRPGRSRSTEADAPQQAVRLTTEGWVQTQNDLQGQRATVHDPWSSMHTTRAVPSSPAQSPPGPRRQSLPQSTPPRASPPFGLPILNGHNGTPYQQTVTLSTSAQAGQLTPTPPGAVAQPMQVELGASRLFKLQFDSRRIICCSQQSVIVGWDFANGDEDISEASQFFGETS